ncbi:MAG: hypothetical protein KAI08_01995 [Bacteroidales bacterium]|nr:hypothetical protein [Bacteroidales bacterium]
MKKTIFILTLLLPVCFLFAQDDNVSDLDQWGNNNDAFVTQTGDLNYSKVYTDGNGNAVSYVNQLGVGENYSRAFQDGKGNTVDVDQENRLTKKYDLNTSYIKQEGDWNTATVDQVVVRNGRYSLGGTLDSDIRQFGNNNDAIVDQEGLWINADIRQNGKEGNANVYQGKSKYYVGDAYVSDALIVQGDQVKKESTAEQHQVGLQNDAYINQNSPNGSMALQVQINTKGVITTHRGIDVNQARIYQSDGGNNAAYQMQFYNNVGGDPNIAYAKQQGKDNFSMEVQVGGDNLSNVLQDGDGNYGNVTQNANGVRTPDLTGPNPFRL